jgi:uncharacterized protein YcgL (UPF0745 family)
MNCVVFRCSRKQEMYLYVPQEQADEAALARLPTALTQLTGRLEKVMELALTPERKLARANVQEVMQSLTEKGFYLQMPPNDLLSADQTMLHEPGDGF